MKLIIYLQTKFLKYSENIIKVQKKYKPSVTDKSINDFSTQEMNRLSSEIKQFKN